MNRTAKRPFKRRALFGLLVLVFACILAEGTSYFVLVCFRGSSPLQKLHKQRQQLAHGGETQTQQRRTPDSEALHPYLGFVTDPTAVPNVNEFGFFQAGDVIQQRSTDRLIVAILGGSVAEQFVQRGAAVLKQELQTTFPNRDIQIVCLAHSAHKQPQQLMTLTYFLALGAEFDVAINIDGFNEVALTVIERHGAPSETSTYYAYPRRWRYRVADFLHPKIVPFLASLQSARQTRRFWAGRFLNPVARYSSTFNLVWLARDASLSRQISNNQWALLTHRQEKSPYVAIGPRRSYRSENELLESAVELWKQCSLQLHKLATANGIRYYHVLQPNPHFPGSKPNMGTDERIATRPGPESTHYRRAVVNGYPMLIEISAELKRAGVRFHNSTNVFRETAEQIYIDACHFNNRGNEILAKSIANHIRTDHAAK